jgi:hypothetical protein
MGREVLIDVLECKTGCEHCSFTIATNRMQVALLLSGAAAAKTPATSTARHGPYLLVRVRVRPELHRAQSCAIALRSPAPERSSDLKRYSPDIHLLPESGDLFPSQGSCAVLSLRGTWAACPAQRAHPAQRALRSVPVAACPSQRALRSVPCTACPSLVREPLGPFPDPSLS